MIGKQDDEEPVALDQEEQIEDYDPAMFASAVDSEMQMAIDMSKIDDMERKSKQIDEHNSLGF